MNIESRIKLWIRQDSLRLLALHYAARLQLNDWCIAAGFVRNLVWDKLHGYETRTPLSDIDLIYFDAMEFSAERDIELEHHLKDISGLNWSVKNQARMHMRNGDRPYISTADAMMHWVEVETAIGARLLDDNGVELIAPFGVDHLERLTITLNCNRPKSADFHARITKKQWLETWPRLRVQE